MCVKIPGKVVSVGRLSHNLIHESKGVGLQLERSPNATIVGNVFDESAETPLAVDERSLASLWSDYNDFVESFNGKLKASADSVSRSRLRLAVRQGDGTIRMLSLSDWQEQTGLDPKSISREPRYEAGVWALASDSPLIGTGPHASVIGPFRKLNVLSARPADDVRAHVVTSTTASFDWWVRGGSAKAFLEWGETPECDNRIELPEAYYHTASLTGLKPGVEYYYRVRTDAKGKRTVYAASADSFNGKPKKAAGIVALVS